MKDEVQSVLFDREKFSRTGAIRWLKQHGFVFSKIDETEKFYRFRQQDPKQFSRMRIKEVEPGIKFILGFK